MKGGARLHHEIWGYEAKDTTTAGGEGWSTGKGERRGKLGAVGTKRREGRYFWGDCTLGET